MKTDRELLEAAARAAGLDVKPHPNARISSAMSFVLDGKNWHPLDDDGDALRLAVKLRLQVHIEDYGTSARLCEGGQWQSGRSSDPAEATRRAIVRAAAAMAEESPA